MLLSLIPDHPPILLESMVSQPGGLGLTEDRKNKTFGRLDSKRKGLPSA